MEEPLRTLSLRFGVYGLGLASDRGTSNGRASTETCNGGASAPTFNGGAFTDTSNGGAPTETSNGGASTKLPMEELLQ